MVWRRMVFIRWKEKAPKGAVARAQNIHQSFARLIPSVLSVTEGFTFTSLADGSGAYPGVQVEEQNRGYHSAIEIIFKNCNTPEELEEEYFKHPVHVAAAKIIDPLIESTWAMDWLEDTDKVVVPSSSTPVMKHICFFKWEHGTTPEQENALFAAWKTLPQNMEHCLAVSCGSAIRWKYGEQLGFDAALVVDLELSSSDGVSEIATYATSDTYQKSNDEFLAPIRNKYVVMDYAVHPILFNPHRHHGKTKKIVNIIQKRKEKKKNKKKKHGKKHRRGSATTTSSDDKNDNIQSKL